MDQAFQTYLTALRRHPLADRTELSDRSALEALLNAAAAEFSTATKIQQEPLRAQGKGAPDFIVKRLGVNVGYVEVKKIGANLDEALKSDQIKRYLDLSPNILVTDYLRFIWIEGGKIKDARSERLCESSAVESKLPLSAERIAKVSELLHAFFSTPPKGVKRASELAQELAVRSKLLRDFLTEELERQETDKGGGKLLGLYQAFKKQVSHELKLQEFADAFAQTLAYGLFLAKLNVRPGVTITLSNADEHVPGGFSLIRELVGFLKELDREEYRDIKWVVEEILSIVNHLNVDAIREDLSFKKRRAYSRDVRARTEEEWRLFSKDPFVYFYEDYLAKYDKAMKKARGVYYTPPPIVNFIVRAINDILKDTFGIEQGLADRERVTVLDFACGTGTFLVEVLERIFDEIGGPEAGTADKYVREHILKNIYGFEYLIAPYTIAHLKLSQYLAELAARANNPDIALKEGERFQVFLTNTLEPIEPQKNFLLPELTHETEAAQRVKDKQILVITGNPPYAYESRNNGPFIGKAIDEYRSTLELSADGLERQPLGERNPRGLQDDYVKFLRFAQMKMDEVPGGVVGVITNHAWLDNATFRGMRQSLMRTFHQIHILDLHGNHKKNEKAPDGTKDENVFDIEQGVAVALFVKNEGLERGVWRGDVFGKRLTKYQFASDASLKSLNLQEAQVQSPEYLFRAQDLAVRAEYNLGWSTPAIFPVNSVGIVTARDDFALSANADEAWRRVNHVAAGEVETIRTEFALGPDTRDWTVAGAISDLRNDALSRDRVRAVHYRPLDSRYTYVTGRSRGFLSYPRTAIWNLLSGNNVALITSRFTKGESFAHALVSTAMIEKIILSPNTSNNGFAFPLFNGDTENLAPAFRAFIDARYDNHYTPEQILGYIYAVLHAPTYRARYGEFLRIDFPRVPFPEARTHFDRLSALGWALVEAHLLKRKKTTKLAQFQSGKSGEGRYRVDRVPRYVEAEQKAYINAESCFAPISPEVWSFHIGGYQVLDKYLRSRKGRDLSLDEIEHIAKVADVLAFTITQMAAINAAYKAAFPQQANAPG